MLHGRLVRALSLDVRPPDPAIAARIRADLTAALDARRIPLADSGPEVGGVRVDASTVPRGTITELNATLELWVGELKRPVKSTPIASTMLPDADAGERVCAVVACAPGVEPLTFDEMRAHLVEQKLITRKLPQQLEIVPELPRNAAGKVQKHALRERYGH